MIFKEKGLVVVLVLVLFIGVFLVSKGFTGMYIVDYSGKSLCNSDSDCGELKCCFYYKSDSGVCGTSDECSRIFLETKQEKEVVGGVTGSEESNYKDKDNTWYFVVGTIFIIISLVTLYIFIKRK